MSFSIRSRLLGLVGMFAVATAGFAAYVVTHTEQHVEESEFAPVNEANLLLADIMPPPLYVIESYLLCHEIVDVADPAARSTLLAELAVKEAEFRDRLSLWERTLPPGPLHDSLRAEVGGTSDAFFKAVHEKYVPAVERGDLEAADELNAGVLLSLFADQRAAVVRTTELTKAETTSRIGVVESEVTLLRYEFMAVAGALIVISAGIGLVMGRDIAGRISAADRALRAMADGDYRVRMDAEGDDELATMAKSLNHAVINVEQAIADVRAIAEGLADSARRLSSSAEEISAGAQSQASALEETAANLEEITATIQASSSRAGGARQLAIASRDVAVQGGQVVEEAVSAMTGINQSSTRIAAIISTIDEIAFQTNLLALNAAVEAARAGEQGRGFAVVAAEVRNLAQRSATAARETKELIQDSQRKVAGGAQLVNRSGEILREIVTSAKGVAETVDEMAGAFRDQSTGVNEVHKAVSQMDTVTQTNSAATTDLSDMSANLASQATQLTQAMSRFQVGVSGHVAAANPGRTPHVAMVAKKTRFGSKVRSAAPPPPRPEPAASGDFPSDSEMFDTL